MELGTARSDSETSEEFFDAEDTTPNRFTKKRVTAGETPGGYVHSHIEGSIIDPPSKQYDNVSSKLSSADGRDDHTFLEPKAFGRSGRQRFQELRQCMQNDDDEQGGNTLTPESQNSSVEGIFVNQKSSHPFRIIEKDAMSVQSMTSLGRVGRILAGSVDPSGISVTELPVSMTGQPLSGSASSDSSKAITAATVQEKQSEPQCDRQDDSDTVSTSSQQGAISKQLFLQEPDVIASTKLSHSKTTDGFISVPGVSGGPIAPPRRKKKVRKVSLSSSEKFHIPDDDFDSISSKQSTNRNYYAMFTANDDDAESLTKEVFAPYSSHRRDFMMPLTADEIPSGLMISHRKGQSLGNSITSINAAKQSPCNSTKSNSAPGATRRNSIDPSKGLNLFKAMQGRYVVQPQDEAANKAEGPSQEELKMFREHINLHHDRSPRFPLSGVGSYSLGNEQRYACKMRAPYKERRKSAGDEDILKQLNIYVRTRTGSGKQLTDFEILEQVPVKNLDTGEKIPLSAVKPPPPPDGWNPLSLHIHKLTSHLEAHQKESDEESIGVHPGSEAAVGDEEECDIEEGGRLRKRTAKIKRFFGSTMRKTVDKAKSIASEVSHARHKEDVADIVDVMNPEQNIKIKASSTNKGPYEFTKLQHVQDLSGEHTGAVWCMKFSSCGRLLATAGQDRVLRIWVLKDAYPFFQDMRTKYNADQKSSPTPSQESLVSHNSAEEAIAMATAAEKTAGPFMPKAFCTYSGHTSDLLDVSWSKNYFILSSSMDKTVRLWHISRRECLCCFQHIDFVTAIAFHPRDDRYFLSGSLDGKLRLWNIPDKKVALWNELDGQTKLITAANFCQNGKFAVVGSYDGRCIFYNTDQLKYHTQIHVRSTRGKNKTGRKISGIEPMPGEDKILVTSNDSRVRLYDLRDLNLSCKYKGYVNVSSQIKGSFSHDGKYIVAGSENQCIYIWKTNHDYSKLSSVRRDRSDFWEGIKAHNATVTCAIFAPHPEAIIKSDPDDEIKPDPPNIPDPLVEQRKKSCGYVLVSADFNGAIKVFINKTKPKHSSLPYTAILD